jgi:hypothetical protein
MVREVKGLEGVDKGTDAGVSGVVAEVEVFFVKILEGGRDGVVLVSQ